MPDELILKYKIKTSIDQYNKNQKELYLNSFIFKIVIIILFFLVLFLGIFFFLPILNAFLIKTNNFVKFILIISVAIITIFFIIATYVVNLRSQINNNSFHSQTLNSGSYGNSDSNKNNNPIEFLESFSQLFYFFYKIFLEPIKSPDKIVFSKEQMVFSLWLINEFIKVDAYMLEYSSIFNKSDNYSELMKKKTLSDLEKMKLISLNETNENKKLLFLSKHFCDLNK